MNIKLISVNIAKPEPVATKSGLSGIFKRPHAGPVEIGPSGLDGDVIVDLENHGGKDQAVYVYTVEDYGWWETQLGCALEPGAFGENLTVSGLGGAEMCVGDRLRIGPVLLEVTSPRIPCNTFAVRMGDPHFIKRFIDARRPGFYCRVLETGTIAAGLGVTVETFPGERVGVLELFENYPYATLSSEDHRRYLSVPTHWKLTAFLRRERARP